MKGVPQGIAGVPSDFHGGLGLDGLDKRSDGLLEGLLEHGAGKLTITQEVEQIPQRSHGIGLHLG